MSAGIPPTYYFDGITFNPSFYQSDGDYLTIKIAKSSFLTYPMSQGDELFTSNITLNSTLTDSSGSKGTSGQVLSSTGTGTNWITSSSSSSGTTYASYSASATLSTAVNPTLIVVLSGAVVGKVITIPNTGYSVGQKIQIKNTGSVDASISTGLVSAFLYSSTGTTLSIPLGVGDVVNLFYTGFTWIQYTPSNTFTKIFGSNGCLAGQTNYVAINTSALNQTISTVINTDMFVFLTGSTPLKILSIPVVTNTGQRITIKNTASVDVALDFPSSSVMLFDSLTTTTGVILKSKGTISFYWGSAFWIQTTVSNAMPELTTSGNITSSSGNISTSAGSISASTTLTAGTGITATSGNITASSGAITASSTITAGTGITATTGSIAASGGAITASTTITAGTGITATTGDIAASGGSVSASTSVKSPSVNGLADTANLGICTTQTSGVINIGTGSRTKTLGTQEGNINIGTGVNTITSGTSGPSINIGTNASASNKTEINIGAGTTYTTINGPLTITGQTSAGAISATGLITTSNNITTTGTGDIQSAGKVKTSILDAVADTTAGNTALKIGSNVLLGDIEIGNAQTTGDIKIGQSDSAGATITVGTSATATTINGTLNTTNGIIAGRASAYDVAAIFPASLSTTAVNTSCEITIYGAAASSGTYTIPTGFPNGQILTFRNISNYAHTIAFTSNIILTGTTTTVSSTTIPVGGYLNVIYGTTQWNEVGASNQIGYTLTGSAGATTNTAIGTAGYNLIATSNLPIGIYSITFSILLDVFSATTGMFLAHTFTTVGCTASIQSPQTTGSLNVSGVVMSGYLICTSATNSCTLKTNTSTGTCKSTNAGYSLIRIA